MENNNPNISLTISKEIVNPIVNAKIQEAILSAMGGGDILIAKAVDYLFNQKVDSNGKISTYQSDNKYTWLEVNVTNQIRKAVEDATKEVLLSRQDILKAAIIKQLSSKKGIEQLAEAIIKGTMPQQYSSRIDVKFERL